MLYTLWRTNGADAGSGARFDDGDVDELVYIGEVTADHSTAAILAGAATWPGETGGEWVAIPRDQLNRLVLTSEPRLTPKTE